MVAQTFVPYGADRFLFVLVQAVWFFTDAATANGIAEIAVEQNLALFLTVFLGNATDLRAHLAALNAVAVGALSDVPALTVRVCNVSFLASTLFGCDASLAVPYGVGWTGAFWCAVGFVADVYVFVAGTLAWAELEGTASSTYNWCSAFLVGDLLHAFVCADHMYAVHSWYFNLF
jgi:hypothetical protein